jgi:uncharacterized membrane protein (UPF0127 family)
MFNKSEALLGWYIEDEPESRSVPVEHITANLNLIRESGSSHPAFMAVVRPAFTGYYKEAADVFLMDQYPVPNEPLIWLSKSMEQAKALAGGKDIWAVIQMFGGQGWKGKGWDREPSYEEMRALSYLAIVHGAKGLFFYTLNDGNFNIRLNSAHAGNAKKLLQELKFLCPFYLAEAAGAVEFLPDSLYEFAPDGTRPVHALMLKDGRQRIIIAVNALDKTVRGRLSGVTDGIDYLDEYFSGKRHVVKDRNILDEFRPYEAKLYIYGRTFKKMRVTANADGSPKAELYCEIAETKLEKVTGLMFRELPSEDRALFISTEKPETFGIHALNCKKAFDLIFIDKKGNITDLYREIQTCDTESSCLRYSSGALSQGAVELMQGSIDRLKLKKGDRVEFY